MNHNGHLQQGAGSICIATLDCAHPRDVRKGIHEISKTVDSSALDNTGCGVCPGSDVGRIEYDPDKEGDEDSQGERNGDEFP